MADMSLAYTPATTLASLIREKKVSPVEVVQNSLARIDEVNGALNAFCFTYQEEALALVNARHRPEMGLDRMILDAVRDPERRLALTAEMKARAVPVSAPHFEELDM